MASAATWLALGFIALVHLLAGHLRFLSYKPRSRWLSAGGGIAVAYAFLHLLPELHGHHRILRQANAPAFSIVQHHAYMVALLGLCAFYGLEHWAKQSRAKNREPGDATTPGVFWISVGAFTLYNALLVYLLAHEGVRDGHELALFTVAVAVHFAVNDHGLYEHHKHLYAYYGRWLLAGGAVLGGVAAHWLDLPDPVMAGMMAFLIGAIVLNVLKEELPDDRESRFGAFTLGALAYAGLLLAI